MQFSGMDELMSLNLNKLEIIKLELSCLCLKQNESLDQLLNLECKEASKLVQQILRFLLESNYGECLKQCLRVKNIFESIMTLKSLSTFQFNSSENYLQDLPVLERKLWLFSCGVSCLQLFVQANWTGPCIEPSQTELLNEESRCCLSEDNQIVYHLIQIPHYFLAAKYIFSVLMEDSCFQTASWWLFRCHCIHSQLLSQRSESLFKETKKILTLTNESSFLSKDENKSLLFQLHLEAGLALLHYYDYKEADREFEAARQLCGVEFSFTGALGVRTKFQEKAVSQLLVLVKRKCDQSMASLVSTKSKEALPVNLSLNDDTLLEKVKLIDENQIKNPELCTEEYCMILAACTAMQKTNPAHRLKQEKLQAVIEFLLESPSCWSVHAEALRLRCLNEKDRSRTVERSMMQLDSLVGLVTSKKTNQTTRLDLFYAVRPPPIWILQKDLAKLYISLGAISSAYQIYEKLEMWEDAVLCLIRTDRTSEAIKIIEKQLKSRETANLWCLLGDILQEPKHYLKAWEFSNYKSTRAMTSLGCYYVSKKDYVKAVEYFEKSLAILSLQQSTWFTMGCALLQLEEYERAAEAFRRCVGLDWDNFEAWTNLSASYVRCGKKDQAYKALSEAIKCNFDKWQLWENYLAICCDVGQFHDAISAYNRLLDLKHKYVDVPVLKILVRAVTEDIVDSNGSPGSLLKPKLLTLFGHVTSQTTGNAEVWELYAHLCGDGVGTDSEENNKAVQLLHRAMRTTMQAAGWEKDDKNIEKLKELTTKIQSGCSHSHLPVQILASVRLTINGLLGKLKLRTKVLINESAQDQLNKTIKDVEEQLRLLNETIQLAR